MSYDFDTLIDRRGTSSLKWDFQQRFVPGSALLPMWVADMDFVAPAEIQEAIRRRVEHGVFGYTLEPDSWFEAAAAWLEERHGWKVPREWMLPSPGVIPGLVAAILALSQPGDGIVIQPPVYYPFPLRITANGRRVVENPLRLTGDRWEMDLDGLEKVIDPGTRMLVLCSPHNPVARVWEPETLRRLAEICASRGLTIVSDEIHCDLAMPGFRHSPIATVSKAAAGISVTLVSATKSFNLAGLGGALSIVADPLLRALLEKSHGALFAGPANAMSVVATEAAWRHGGAWLDELLACVHANFQHMKGFLERHLAVVKVFPLEGTYLALLDMRGLHVSDERLNDILRGTAKVWLDEGTMFGRGGEGLQRINLACPRGVLSECLTRMEAAFGGTHPSPR
jgi:cysteine-S-conjugate beta-lyase